MECSLLSSTQYLLSALQKCEVSVLLFAGVIRHGLEKPNSSHREEEAPRRLGVDAALEKIRSTCPPTPMNHQPPLRYLREEVGPVSDLGLLTS